MLTIKKYIHTILSPLREAGGVFVCVCVIVCVPFFTSCRKSVDTTVIHVVDPVRHYLPIVQGDDLRLSFRVHNKGKEVLVFTDVMPACLSIERVDDAPDFLLPGDSLDLCFVYHTLQNIGLAEHAIRLYGNFGTNGVVELVFDVNIVRPTIDHSDYEEIFYKRQKELERLVDGEKGEKGYYTDSTIYDLLQQVVLPIALESALESAE